MVLQLRAHRFSFVKPVVDYSRATRARRLPVVPRDVLVNVLGPPVGTVSQYSSDCLANTLAIDGAARVGYGRAVHAFRMLLAICATKVGCACDAFSSNDKKNTSS